MSVWELIACSSNHFAINTTAITPVSAALNVDTTAKVDSTCSSHASTPVISYIEQLTINSSEKDSQMISSLDTVRIFVSLTHTVTIFQATAIYLYCVSCLLNIYSTNDTIQHLFAQ